MKEKLIILVRSIRVFLEQQKLQNAQHRKELKTIDVVLKEAEECLGIQSPD
tara:strand:+ start:1561 stop:1713 length:153 start_codon:yes stop_codon:yes gene_type:complete